MIACHNIISDVKKKLKSDLACRTESLFMTLSKPHMKVRRSPLSMEKHYKKMCSYTHKKLGILINTRRITFRIPDNKHKDLIKIMLTTWNSSRKRLKLREVASLLRLVENLTLETQRVKRACIAL